MAVLYESFLILYNQDKHPVCVADRLRDLQHTQKKFFGGVSSTANSSAVWWSMVSGVFLFGDKQFDAAERFGVAHFQVLFLPGHFCDAFSPFL